MFNFHLDPSLTLGCGSWGSTSVSANVGPQHLINIKTTAIRQDNMLWFRVPPRVYFKRGCLELALKELKTWWVGGRVWQGRRNGREREGRGTPGRHAIIIVQQQYTCNRKRGRKVEHRTWLPFSQPLQPSQAAAAGAEQIAKLPNCQHF